MARMGDGDVDETPAGQLCQEIAEGRIEAACRLLKGSPSLAAEADKDGMLPLHWAADRGDLQMAWPLGTRMNPMDLWRQVKFLLAGTSIAAWVVCG